MTQLFCLIYGLHKQCPNEFIVSIVHLIVQNDTLKSHYHSDQGYMVTSSGRSAYEGSKGGNQLIHIRSKPKQNVVAFHNVNHVMLMVRFRFTCLIISLTHK